MPDQSQIEALAYENADLMRKLEAQTQMTIAMFCGMIITMEERTGVGSGRILATTLFDEEYPDLEFTTMPQELFPPEVKDAISNMQNKLQVIAGGENANYNLRDVANYLQNLSVGELKAH